ncbi:MAG: hypothetical protein ABR956_18320 [Terracidiphilus sp.]|jgi:hypothetical protein
MPKQSVFDRAIKLAVSDSGLPPATTLGPEPDPKSSKTSSPRAAVRRCRAAWQRAFDEFLADCEGDDFDRTLAAKPAGEAYRNAMPMLIGFNGIRDYIACAAHGILLGAIPKESANEVLYAAQVALTTLSHQPKPSNHSPQ